MSVDVFRDRGRHRLPSGSEGDCIVYRELHRDLQIPAKLRVIFYKNGQSLKYSVDGGEEGREAIQEAVLIIRNGAN